MKYPLASHRKRAMKWISNAWSALTLNRVEYFIGSDSKTWRTTLDPYPICFIQSDKSALTDMLVLFRHLLSIEIRGYMYRIVLVQDISPNSLFSKIFLNLYAPQKERKIRARTNQGTGCSRRICFQIVFLFVEEFRKNSLRWCVLLENSSWLHYHVLRLRCFSPGSFAKVMFNHGRFVWNERKRIELWISARLPP